MSTFKTRAEMTSANEFIQYLEQLRSGSLASATGTNRALERLAESQNALLEAVQAAKMSFLEGGGTISFAASTLTWSSNLVLHFPGELGTVKTNVITAGSIAALTEGKIVYVVLDRATEGAVVAPVTVADMTAFLAVITGAAARLDYLILGRVSAGGFTFFDGRRVLTGYAFSGNGNTDTQYGQQTELTTVHENQKENLRFFLTGGGDISWDVSAEEFWFSANIIIEFPSSAGHNRVQTASSPIPIPAGFAAYVTLTRSPGGVVNVVPTVVAIGLVPDTDDVLVLAMHKSDGRLYLCNGQSLLDGETSRLGGVAVGVQWFYQAFGSGTQVTDFTVSGAFPSRSYRVGTGALMVYRNGQKARGSSAYWNGIFPAGALVGALSTHDQYVEELQSVGTGSRILWLSDGSTPGHAASTHDPAWTFPASDDSIEAFVGVQGQGADFMEENAVLGSTSIEVTETSPGSFTFKVKPPHDDGLVNSSVPSATNPYTVHSDFDLMSGFEVVWCTKGSTREVMTGGGILRTNGVAYRSISTATRVSILDSNIFPADTLVNSAWNYLYLYAGLSAGAAPQGVVASLAPASVGWGIHPTDATYKFLSSVYLSSTGQFQPFIKNGNLVTLGFDHDIVAAFGALGFTGTGTYTAVDLSGAYLPVGVRQVKMRLRCEVDTAAVTVGTRVELRVRNPSFTVHKSYFATRANDDTVDFEVDLLLDQNDQIEISGSADINSVTSAVVLSYVEGRYTSATGMGA